MDNKFNFSKKGVIDSIIDLNNKRKNILNNDAYKDLTSAEKRTIAGMHNGIKNLITDLKDSMIIVGGSKKDYSKPKFQDDSVIGETVYKRLNKNKFFETLAGDLSNITKNQSGKQLMSNVIKMDGINPINKVNYNRTTKSGMVDFQNLFNATNNFSNILNNGGTLVSYDLETLGGVNSYGHQQFDYITELSSSVFKLNKDGSKKEIHTINSLLGFSDGEYNKVKNYIEGLRGKAPGELNEMDNVYLKRLSLLSDSGFTYKQNDLNKFEFRVEYASNPDTIESSVDNALKGLEKYREIGKLQETVSGKTGAAFESYKKDYIRTYKNLVYDGKLPDGNSIGDYVAIAHNSAMFDDKAVGIILGETVEHKAGRGLDTYQMIKYSQEFNGQAAHIPNGVKAVNEFGIGTQDQLKKILGYAEVEKESGVAAHNAYEDAVTLLNILTDKNIFKNSQSYGKFLSDRIYDVNSKLTNLKNVHQFDNSINATGVFLMDKTSQKEFGSNKNGLSFIYNPLDRSYKTHDGFRIGEDGSVVKEGFNGFGPKANALYTHEAYKIDLNSDSWKKIFNNIDIPEKDRERFYEQYSNSKSLYVLKSKEYIDEEINKAKYGENNVFKDAPVHVRLFTSEDQLATAMGTKVANVIDGDISFLPDSIKGLNLKTTAVEDGKVVVKDVTNTKEAEKMLLNRSAYRTGTDSAARTIRDMEYERVAKLARYSKENGKTISQRIAELVASNTPLKQNITQSLIEELGWEDFKTKQKTILPETVAKTNVLDRYAQALNPVLNIMNDVFEKMNIKDSFKVTEKDGIKIVNSSSNKTLKAQKNIMFQNTLTNVLEEITSNPSNSLPTIFTGDELNKVDFLRADLFPELEINQMGRSIINQNSKYVSLDLTKNDALLNMFYNNIYGNVDIERNSNAGFDSLFRAYDAIGSDTRFAGVWNGLTEEDLFKFQKEGNLSQLNSLMLNKLQTFVNDKRAEEGNSGFGLSYSRLVQDYSNVDDLGKALSEYDPKKLRKLIESNMDKFSSEVYIADGENKNLINDLVNRYFMPFSKNDFMKSTEGLTKSQKDVLGAQFHLSRQEAYRSASDIISAIKDTNMNIGVVGKGSDSVLFLQRGNEIKTLDMHKYVLNNGIINHRINGNDYATNFAYNVNELINKQGKFTADPNDLYKGIKVTSNVQNALGQTYSIKQAVQYAEKGNQDKFLAIVNKIKKDNGLLREVGARRENFNYNNTLERAMQINTNSLISILPELQNQGLISELEKTFNIGENESSSMKTLIEKIKNMSSRPKNINELLASEQNLFYDVYHQPLIEFINSKSHLGDVGSVIKNSINPHVQDTKYAEGIMTLNTSPFSHGAAKFDPTSRSVAIQQGNSILYNRNQLEKDLRSDIAKGKDLTIGGRLMTGASSKYVAHNGEQTAGLTIRYLQINSNDLRSIFMDDVKKAREGKDNKFSKFLGDKFGKIENLSQASQMLAERSMRLSTYEQQSAINARVSYVAFHKNNSQIINAKKELIVEHTENLGVIESIKNAHKLPVKIVNGKIEYQLGHDVKKGEVIGAFGSIDNVVYSRFNGVLRGRYFDKNTEQIVSEDELNAFISGKKWSKNKIYEELNKKYDFKFQVINKFEDYGHKIYNDASEKSTADVMDVALGSIDKGLINILENKGLGDLGGKVLSREYIEDHLSKILSPDIINRMLNERFALSDAIQTFEPLKDIDQITNLNVLKHGSISMGLTDVVERLNRDPNTKKDIDAYYKALFGKNYKTLEDGTLLLDNVGDITLDNFKGLTDKQNERLKNILEAKSNFVEYNGKVIGHKGYSYVTHAYDDPSGTYAGNEDLSKLEKEYNNIRKNLATEKDPEKIQQLNSRLSEVNFEMGKLETQKGLKFDDRMNLNLQRAVYDNDSIGLAKTKLSKDDFNKYFGYALNDEGKVSADYFGKSILDPVTSVMRDKVLIGYGEKRLSSVEGKGKYKYLLDSYGDMKDMISVEKAEKAYSYQQGIKALEFNSSKGFSQTMYDNLVNGNRHKYNNFRVVDLSNIVPNKPGQWLDLDIGGQGKTVASSKNNPYTNNLMIKTGLGGDRDYLAIARMPERHFDESLIKTSHIQKLNELQRALQQLNSGNIKSKEERDNVTSYAKRVYDEIVTSQKHDLTSKNGLYGDLISTRLSQSYFGKASGLTITSNLDKAFGKQDINELRAMNSKTFLDTAEFEGKTLLEHYAEGKAIDAVGVSRQAFEDMGYFKDNFVKKVFGENGTVKQMEEHLQTKGDTFVATRFPRIQEASDKVVMGYLDPTLKGNQIMAMGYTGASMNLDHDGDIFAVARITNKNDESFLNYAAQGRNYDDFIKSQQSMIMERAVNANAYWESKIQSHLVKEQEVALSGNSLQNIAKKEIIDNKVFSAIMDIRDMKPSQMHQLLSKYSDFVTDAIKTGTHNLEGLEKTFAVNGKLFDDVKKEYATAYSYQKLKDEVIAKAAKNAIGEINVTNFKIKDVAVSLMDKTADNYSYKSRLMYDFMHLSEQAAISSKSSTEGLDPDRAKKWNDTATAFIKNEGNAEEHIAAMQDWSKKYLYKDIDHSYYWNTSKAFQNAAAETLNNNKPLTEEAFNSLMTIGENKEKMQGRMVNDFIESLSSLRGVEGVDNALKYLSYGNSTKGVTQAMTTPVSINGFENARDKLVQLFKKSDGDLQNDLNFINLEETARESKFGRPNIIDRVISEGAENIESEAKSIGRQVLEGAHDMFKAVKGSGIAMGAIGIAAGVMALGYVGGRPRPADTQAMEEAQDYQEPQGGLMDPNLAPMPMSGAQQGYVININARSDKGRNHAISAIQQAISSGTSSSVNISMNINDNYGNISDRDIQKAIKDAF